MEKYFDIRYEFDVPTVHATIDEHIADGKTGYICVADGNILTMVHRDEEYRSTVDGSIFSICDSSWVPKFVKWIYGYDRHHYCGSDIFIDVVRTRKHRMIFLGTKQNVLDALQQNLAKENPDVAGMTFKELPFCTVDQFDYAGIARMIEQDGADIIWVALGAPKQEQFMQPRSSKEYSLREQIQMMSRLTPHQAAAATLRLGGYTHKEIAKLMDITTAQAEAHLGKACHTLGHVWDN